MRYLSITLYAAAAALSLSLVFSLLNRPPTASPDGRPAYSSFTVHQGQNVHSVARDLARSGHIRSARFFVSLVRLSGAARAVKAGEYELAKGMKTTDIVRAFTRGTIAMERFTIPEGLTIRQVAELLEREGVVKSGDFINACSDRGLLEKYGIPFETVEGFLFPDTYVVAKGLDASRIAEIMIRRFFDVLAEAPLSGVDRTALAKIVVIASLVEKEAKLDEERALISAVFYNRLKLGKRLESCATVQYVLQKPKERLLFSDLKVNSPYNTYLHAGLPPGPIANPGKKSLIAAVRPAAVGYLFFVVKENGSHHFSSTYEEHLKAIRRYNIAGRVGHQLS